MLLIEGILHAQSDLLELNVDENSTVSQRKKAYLSEIENILNNEVLGSEGNEAQYKIPIEKQKGETTTKNGTIKMENYRMRRIINELDQIIEKSVVDNNNNSESNLRKLKWKQCLNHYRELMRIMQKKGTNYTHEELSSYQNHADIFFQLWVQLHGRDGVTNYIHMIGSGHVLEYMKRWGNLTKYSQQGWEALNALIKLFFFRRTNKGGSRSSV